MVVWDPPHLLVLDEVTTHLDSDSIVALVGEMKQYEGALLVVTHDRFFMRRVIEGEENDDEDTEVGKVGEVYLLEKGKLSRLEGGVADYEKKAGKKQKRKII